jgi:hypothetical protein
MLYVQSLWMVSDPFAMATYSTLTAATGKSA